MRAAAGSEAIALSGLEAPVFFISVFSASGLTITILFVRVGRAVELLFVGIEEVRVLVLFIAAAGTG
jgi:hypothetical protein